MSSWSEEHRRDLAARDQRRRDNQRAEDDRRRDNRRKDKEEKRLDKARDRRERMQRRLARAARREKALTPGNVYKRGTLLLVGLSAAASLPAQIMHFGEISWTLLSIGPAVEGAAWVLAAGVAYADERGLPAWVRWLLRVLSMSAAMFAANVNHQFGLSLVGQGLTHSQAQTAGLGLAAVTLGGPLFFEVRQWVLTLSASAVSPKQRKADKAKRKHDKQRAKAFPDVADRAEQLILAAPFGTLSAEAAWDQAWEQTKGAPRGSTAAWYADQLDAEEDVAAVLEARGHTRDRLAVDAFLADVFGAGKGDGGPSGTVGSKPKGGPRGGGSEGRISLERKGKRGVRGSSTKTPSRPLAEADLEKVRKLAEVLGGTDRLSVRNVKDAVGGGATEYLVRLRRAVQSEGSEGDQK